MEQKLFGSRSDVGLGRVCPQLTKRNINGGSFKASGTRTDRGSPLVSRPSAKSLVSRTERRASTGLIGIARDQVVQPSPEGVRTRRRWRIISVQPSCDILDLKVLWNEARPVLLLTCGRQHGRKRPSSRSVPAINGTFPPAPRDSRLAGESRRMPSGPSRTGRRGNNSIAIAASMPVWSSDELADMRQENVLFGASECVAQDGVFCAKSIQEGVAR